MQLSVLCGLPQRTAFKFLGFAPGFGEAGLPPGMIPIDFPGRIGYNESILFIGGFPDMDDDSSTANPYILILYSFCVAYLRC